MSMTTDPGKSGPRSPLDEVLAPIRLARPLQTETRILLIILAVFALWGLAILTFGVPALVWPMKLIVPACVVMLVVITWSK